MGIWFLWQRMRDSNPRKRSQSPVCYRYTNPLSHGRILLYASCWKCQELFMKSLERELMHPKTRRELEYILTMLAEVGEKETFRYLKKEVLKDKPFPWEEE